MQCEPYYGIPSTSDGSGHVSNYERVVSFCRREEFDAKVMLDYRCVDGAFSPEVKNAILHHTSVAVFGKRKLCVKLVGVRLH